jgi:hypothetical protein
MSDDRLIYKLSVDTDYILNKNVFKDRDDIICLIKVRISGNKYFEKYRDLII